MLPAKKYFVFCFFCVSFKTLYILNYFLKKIKGLCFFLLWKTKNDFDAILLKHTRLDADRGKIEALCEMYLVIH